MIFKVNYKVSRRIIEFFIFTRRGKNKGLQSFIATRQSFLGKIVKIGKYIWDENFWSRYSMGGTHFKIYKGSMFNPLIKTPLQRMTTTEYI